MAPSDLFSTGLVDSYVGDRRFVARQWLVDKVEQAWRREDAHFVLVTGESGSGKSALMADLARRHPTAPRHFIRRDSMSPLQGGDARTLLFSVGYQLAQLHPELFDPKQLEIVVDVRARRVAAGGVAVGIKADDLRASPFYQQSRRVTARSDLVEGELIGLSAGTVTLEPRLLELSNLQYMALFDPAEVRRAESPDDLIVILVDALDEIRWGPAGESILSWLAMCPELPPNVRIVLSSRPDDDLLRSFRTVQGSRITELSIDNHPAKAEDDVRCYLAAFESEPAVRRAMIDHRVPSASFVNDATFKAQGNFQYAVALVRSIESALLAEAPPEDVGPLLRLEGVPEKTTELYRFFLGRIKDRADRGPLKVSTGPLDEPESRDAWEVLYRPILAVLSIAFEPVGPEQIQKYALLPPGTLARGLEELGQFLDRLPDGRYRLYHATLPEYLTGAATDSPADPFHVDPATWHGLLAGRLLRASAEWAATTDPYALAHTAAHLVEATRLQVDRHHREGVASEVIRLLTDLRFLARKTQALGIDLLLEDCRSALSLLAGETTPGVAVLEAVAGALRRSRVALARDPDELAGQLHGRLLGQGEPVAGIMAALGAITPAFWLRARTAALAWRDELDATIPVHEKVRALAFGVVEGTTLLAIGTGDDVVLHDPLRGGSQRTVRGGEGNVVALALAHVGRRAALVLGSRSQDGHHVVVRDALTLEQVGVDRRGLGSVDSVTVGSLHGRVVVAARDGGHALAWDLYTGDPVAVASDELPGDVVGVATVDGRLVLHVMTIDGPTPAFSVVDGGSGARLGPEVAHAMEPRAPVASTEVGARMLVAAWWHPATVGLWFADTGEPFGPLYDLGNTELRCLATGTIGGHAVVAGSPEHEDAGVVYVRDASSRPRLAPKRPLNALELPVHSLAATADGRLRVLTGNSLRVREIVAEGREPFGCEFDPTPEVVGEMLVGDSGAGNVVVSLDDALRLVDVFDIGRSPKASPRGAVQTFRRDEPLQWSATARAHGVVGGRAVLAVGSYGGAVWLWDIETRSLVAGPFADVEDEIAVLPPGVKAARPPHVQSMAIGRTGGRDVVATACGSTLTLWDIAVGRRLPSPDIGDDVILSVSLGSVAGRDVVVTGSRRGVVSVWDSPSGQRLAALTLDDSIDGVWAVAGADVVAALTPDRQLHLFDVVRGGHD